MQLSVKDDHSGCRDRIQNNSRYYPRYGNGHIFPDRIEVSGESKIVAEHLRDNLRQGRVEITTFRVRKVLENWLVRGVTEDNSGQAGWAYWGEVEYSGKRKLMRVVLSMDRETIASAYLDRKATKLWLKGEATYFTRVCLSDIEVQDGFAETGLRCGD